MSHLPYWDRDKPSMETVFSTLSDALNLLAESLPIAMEHAGSVPISQRIAFWRSLIVFDGETDVSIDPTDIDGTLSEWADSCATLALSAALDEPLADYLTRQWEWSRRTFGEGRFTFGITAHIRKELAEIEAKPDDLSEWVDVAILAMDGYWRHGGKPDTFMEDLLAKQQKNFARTWPTPVSEDEAVEHDRSGESPTGTPKGDAE